MRRLYSGPDDFEAAIRILSFSARGRMTPAFNGLRWDFAYADDPESHLHAIWPDFIDENGDSFLPEYLLPVDVFLKARMTIVSDEMRAQFHLRRIKAGLRFFCHEGSKRVAEGQVVKLTGLYLPRSERPIVAHEMLNSLVS